MTGTKPCIFCHGLKQLTIVEMKRRVVCPVCNGSGVFSFEYQKEESHE